MRHFSSQVRNDQDNFPTDVNYLCVQLNNTIIGFEDFQDILYGFLTGQCDDFEARVSEKITFEDVKRTTNSIDFGIQVIKIDECKLPEVNTYSVFVNFSQIEENIYLKKRKNINSDVLVCGV